MSKSNHTTDLETTIREKFSHLSDQQLLNKCNRAGDFNRDDEEYELVRRMKASNGAWTIKMQGNRAVIVHNNN